MDIKSLSGAILFSAEVSTVKELVIAAVKSKINLRGANLSEANLSGASLSGASLSGANLSGADLSGADLYGANLRGANLSGADLSKANLRGADLYGADLSGADLSGANLSKANLYGASLSEANLSGASLSGASLSKASLSGADLSGVQNLSDKIIAETMLLPEGDLVGWKKCRDNVIVKLLIPQRARRSNSTGRKCRAEYVQVLRVYGAEVGISTHNSKTEYRKGAIVKCDQWNDDRWIECGGGIHFFITRTEAEAY